MLNPDFRDMLLALSDENVEWLLVGAYALAAHGLPRATGDIDVWINTSKENAVRVLAALKRFGAPTIDLSETDLTTSGTVFQIGLAPRRVDILTSIDGVNFAEAWRVREQKQVDGIDVNVISKRHLMQNKRAVGRPKDLIDVAWLEQET